MKPVLTGSGTTNNKGNTVSQIGFVSGIRKWIIWLCDSGECYRKRKILAEFKTEIVIALDNHGKFVRLSRIVV